MYTASGTKVVSVNMHSAFVVRAAVLIGIIVLGGCTGPTVADPNDGENADRDDPTGSIIAGQGLSMSNDTLSLDAAFTDARYWKVGGNAGTNAAAFLGTTDNFGFELRTNNVPVIQLAADGSVGTGAAPDPAFKLNVGGALRATALRLDASPGEGLVLTSNTSGDATWQPVSLALPYQASENATTALLSLTNSGTGPAVEAVSADGQGVSGVSTSGTGVYASSTTGVGLQANASDTGKAAEFSIASGTNTNPAVTITHAGEGKALDVRLTKTDGTGTALEVTQAGWGSGIRVNLTGNSGGGHGISVNCSAGGAGVFANTTASNALWGIAHSMSSAAVIGDNATGECIVGRCSNGGSGVGAVVGRQDGDGGYGVRGFTTGAGSIGVIGQAGMSASSSIAGKFENVNASNSQSALVVTTNSTAGGRAADITGNVRITGNLQVTGSVSKGSGSFVIDHPLDPENKYLYHSFVESSEMKNVYDGVTRLDAAGEAWVELPSWFEALNGDFRYQLTAIGAAAPSLHIAEEVANNRFKIAGGPAGLKVSWQVTGVRRDPYAQVHPIAVEADKGADRGTYLHPEAYGLSADRGIDLGAATPASVDSPAFAKVRGAAPAAAVPLASDSPAETAK